MFKRRPSSQLLARLHTILLGTTLALVAVITLGAIMIAFHIQDNLSNRTDTHFVADTTAMTRAILENSKRCNTALIDTHNLLMGDPSISQDDWRSYFTNQKIFERNSAISSISYIELIPQASKEQFTQTMRSIKDFGENFAIKPAGDRPVYAVASLVAASRDVSSSYGFDSYSTKDRKAIYQLAEALNRPVASQPFKLATGQYGFFITLPILEQPGQAKGFITMSIYAADFLAGLHDNGPNAVAAKLTDVSDSKHPADMFQTASWDSTPPELTRFDTVAFAGRIWKVDYRSSRGYKDSFMNFVAPRSILIGAGILILGILVGFTIYERRYAATQQ